MKKLLIISLALIVLFLSDEAAYTQIIFSDNDYGCGWENYASSVTVENSYEIGVNVAVYASGGSGFMTIMQVIHSGDYNPDSGSLQHLVNEINSRTGVTVSNGGLATLGTTDLSNVDLLYITGHYPFSLSTDEKTALKDYLQDGGVLFADDCSNYLDNEGFETSFRNLVNELYGGSLELLPSDHAIYSSYYSLDGSDFSYSASGNGTQWNTEPLEVFTPLITVAVDIKPGSCPNPVNVKSSGLLPVAILGSDEFDVGMIDPTSIMLAGVSAIRSSYEDVATAVSDVTSSAAGIVALEDPCCSNGECPEDPCCEDGVCPEDPCCEDGVCPGDPCCEDGICPGDPCCVDGECPGVPDGNACDCTTEGADGNLDLTLKFRNQDIVEAIGEVNDGQYWLLGLTGVLYDGTPIAGSDCIVIRGRYKPFNKADINKDGVVNNVDFSIFSKNWLKSSIIEE
ncbi:MAG: DUF4159 domain-containing protein [Planctomycetota bacterium]|jgi:hypothetical protein